MDRQSTEVVLRSPPPLIVVVAEKPRLHRGEVLLQVHPRHEVHIAGVGRIGRLEGREALPGWRELFCLRFVLHVVAPHSLVALALRRELRRRIQHDALQAVLPAELQVLGLAHDRVEARLDEGARRDIVGRRAPARDHELLHPPRLRAARGSEGRQQQRCCRSAHGGALLRGIAAGFALRPCRSSRPEVHSCSTIRQGRISERGELRCRPLHPPPRNRTPMGTPPLRVALVGAGGIGRAHRNAWAKVPGAQIVAVVDVDLDRAQTMAAELDAPAFVDHAAMLSAVAPEVVDVCTPPAMHRPVVVDCLQAG
ncbi:MAG: hypothetical protein FJX74_06825, partial [Armatimonadetes bacterium]|nr:hypothetical protein [Armatimonadota bacterium]